MKSTVAPMFPIPRRATPFLVALYKHVKALTNMMGVLQLGTGVKLESCFDPLI